MVEEKNVRTLKVKQGSRLRFQKLIRLGEWEWFDLYNYPTIEPDETDEIIEVSASFSADVLAYRFYGDASMWWVICLANDLELFSADVRSGMKLRIPTKERVETIFEVWKTKR